MLKAPIDILINDVDVQGLVGQNDEGTKYKVYPVVAPSTEIAPYIVLRIVSQVPVCKGSTSYAVDFSVASYHTSYDSVYALDQAVINSFEEAAAATHEGIGMSTASAINVSVDDYVKERELYVKISTFHVNIEN